ncbi:hypothetical protein PC116_g34101 [Phytophthora cactorum]|nr:hypothetical protein PC116_g34101 [Phytophthora cactorum]
MRRRDTKAVRPMRASYARRQMVSEMEVVQTKT